MDYKKAIKNYMKLNHISYAALAREMGISRQAVWGALNGRKRNNPTNPPGSRALTEDLAERIIEALGLEIRIGRR